MHTRQISLRAGTLAAILGAMLLAACYPVRRGEPFNGPLNVADASVQRGKLLFDKYCYHCHTNGEGGLAPSFNDKPLPRFAMHFQVRHGLGAMPAFSEQELSEADLNDILNYIEAIRHQPFIANP